MNLLLLAPDIQDALLNADHESCIQEHRIRSAAQHVSWAAQRAILAALLRGYIVAPVE
jgi:hypothetical protein